MVWFLLSLILHLSAGYFLWKFLPADEPVTLSANDVVDLTLADLPTIRSEVQSLRQLPPRATLSPSVAAPQPGIAESETTAATDSSPSTTATEDSAADGAANEGAAWSEVTKFPRVAKEYKAVYPEQAKTAGIDGTVVLDVLINTEGKVQTVQLVSGPGYGLNESAIEALKKFEFSPAQRRDKNVAVKIRYSYKFKLGVN
ncbi:MAG: TonB family protein [Bdellovibrio sp.]